MAHCAARKVGPTQEGGMSSEGSSFNGSLVVDGLKPILKPEPEI